jgi:hypothetical protein
MSGTTIWLIMSFTLSLGGLMFLKGAHIKWEWKDIWQGVYFGKDAIYICPIPCLVFIFPRKQNNL